jgi:C7-C12 aromatase (ARO/CYC)
MSPQTRTTNDEAEIAAPLDVVYDLVVDVARWTQLHAPAVEAEVLERDASSELIRHWSLIDNDAMRDWTVRRWLDRENRVIRYAHEPAEQPFVRIGGDWTFEPKDDNTTIVRMRHEFEPVETEPKTVDWIAANLSAGSRSYLATLKDSAEHREELADLIVDFSDQLFIAGSIKDVYDYLYDAAKWPERIPHVSRLFLTEPVPGVQFFDMDTKTPDGSAHTTRSVRVCHEPDLIVYKQIRLPALLDAHTGHWRFTETREGVIAEARHTATIKPSALSILGDGATVLTARKYLRRVLSANSVSNLRLAKEYAEERAGV